jgi:hypothetical protein
LLVRRTQQIRLRVKRSKNGETCANIQTAKRSKNSETNSIEAKEFDCPESETISIRAKDNFSAKFNSSIDSSYDNLIDIAVREKWKDIVVYLLSLELPNEIINKEKIELNEGNCVGALRLNDLELTRVIFERDDFCDEYIFNNTAEIIRFLTENLNEEIIKVFGTLEGFDFAANNNMLVNKAFDAGRINTVNFLLKHKNVKIDAFMSRSIRQLIDSLKKSIRSDLGTGIIIIVLLCLLGWLVISGILKYFH